MRLIHFLLCRLGHHGRTIKVHPEMWRMHVLCERCGEWRYKPYNWSPDWKAEWGR